jgi:signal transduction histidine kinase
MLLPSNLDEFDQESEKYIKIKIEISDTGVGIKKENLSKLFMDFGKLDEHSKINAQGTGLGLSICKKMIEKMGGTVSVDSVEGKGTTFTVSLVMKA